MNFHSLFYLLLCVLLIFSYALFAAAFGFIARIPALAHISEPFLLQYLPRASPKCSLSVPKLPSMRLRSLCLFLNQHSYICTTLGFSLKGLNDSLTPSSFSKTMIRLMCKTLNSWEISIMSAIYV